MYIIVIVRVLKRYEYIPLKKFIHHPIPLLSRPSSKCMNLSREHGINRTDEGRRIYAVKALDW
jgi:hypothetical protein